MEQNPGLVTFNNPGVYEVVFKVIDALGVADPTPATVMITVLDPTAQDLPPERPTAAIVSPDSDLEIVVGDSIEFIGEAFDPAGGELKYEWEFDGAAPEAKVLSPGMVTFTRTGTFRVKFEATSKVTGLHADPDPMVTITVVPEPAPASTTP
jgi:hypothetical protein